MKLLIHYPNFNGCTVEVWEWISNFIPHFLGHVITYACYFQINVLVYKWISHSIDEQFNMVFTKGKGAQAGTIINVEKNYCNQSMKNKKMITSFLFPHKKKYKKKERYILPNPTLLIPVLDIRTLPGSIGYSSGKLSWKWPPNDTTNTSVR